MSNELEQQVPDAAGVEAEAPQQDTTQPQQASTPQPQQASPSQPIQLDLSKSVPVAKPEAAPVQLDLSKSVPVNVPSPGTNAGAAKGTRFETYAKMGNYFLAKPMEGETALRPALKSLHGFLSFPNALYHAFQDPATPQEKAEIAQKMNQMRAGQNKTSTPGDVLPAAPAYSTLPAVPGQYVGAATNTYDKNPPAPTRTQLALHRLIDAPAEQLDAKANKELETARELWDQREDWSTSIPTGMGVSIPLGHAVAISGSLSGAADKLLSKIPMLGPLVNGIAEKFENGDIEGGMTDLALLKAAEAAHAKLTGEPVGNPSKIWSEKGNQFGEHVREVFKKTQDLSDKANAAKEDFVKAAPPSKAAPYSVEPGGDYDIVRRTAEENHKADKLKGGEGISGIETARDIVEDGRQSIEDKRSGAVKEHADRPITTNVYQDVAKSLEQAENTTPGFRDEGMKILEKHDFKDATVGEADAIRKKLVADNRAIQKKNMWDVNTARQTDATFAAREAAIDSLRKGIYGALDEAGVPGVYDLARDEAAHIRVRDAIERQMFNAEKTVRGTSGATPMRKVAAGVAKAGAATAGTGIGAAIGGVPGAIIGGAAGGVAGEGIARAILPPDMTRDALMARSFENPDLATPGGPSVPESQATPAGSATPGPELPPPPAPIPPAMPPPDHALHAALATRVGSTVERTDFPTLMNKFQRYLERTPVEKLTDGDRELLQQLNESQGNRRLQVDDAMKVAVEKNKVAREKWQKEVQKIQEKHAAEQEALKKSNIVAVENDERPTDENPHLASLGRGDESGLVSHSPAMKAHSPAESINAAKGITSDMAHRHEWAHMALNAIDSENPSGNAILAASHPEAGGAATSLFDMSHLFTEGGTLDPDTLRAEETRLLTQKLAGPASHEVFDGMTKDEAMSHAGTRSDVRQARQLVRDIHPEFSPSQVEQVVDAAYERARNFLTQPHVADRIKANAAVRETGLNGDYHASRGRVTQFQDDIRKAHEENGNEPQPSGGGTGEGGEKAESPRAEEGKKNAGGSKERSAREPRESARQPETARGVSESQVDKAAKGLTERTTGSPETDEAIKKGGGVPAGVLGHLDEDHVKMFHDPETGTTLGFAGNEPVTAEATKAKLEASRAQYAEAAKPKTAYHPDLQKVVDQNKLTNTLPDNASFLTPDGKFVDLSTTHPEAIKAATGEDFNDAALSEKIKNEEPGTEDNRVKFLNDTGAIRTRLRQTMAGTELVASVPKQGVTEAQLRSLRKAVGRVGREGNLVIERSDASPENPLFARKEFPRVGDVDQMLRDIQAHPDQAAGKKPGIVKALSDTADEYNKAEGRAPINEKKLQVDPRQMEMADAYAAAEHAPNDPQVKAAYDSFKKDIDKQFELLGKHGIKVDAYAHDPYEGDNLGKGGDESGAEAAYRGLRNDVVNNKHISVWKGGAPPADHPLSEVDSKTGLTYNEKLRAIHDLFGHVVPDNGFDAAGEESAWGVHNQMFAPESRPALATETRGQTAYVTKNGEFANQKATILPKEFHVRPEDLGQPESMANKSMPLWWNDQVANDVYGGDTKGGKLVKDAAANGGFTIHPRTGDAPTDGYMVETMPKARVELGGDPKNTDVLDFMNKNRAAFDGDKNLYAGGYKNGQSGKFELNVAKRFDNLDDAIAAAKKNNQISLWDVKEGKEIPTGGTGEVLKPEDLEKSNVAKKSPKGSSVPLMDNPLPVKGTMEGGEVGTLDVAKALNKFSRDKNPVLEPGSEPKEMVDRAKKLAEDEAKYQLAQSKTGTEWYTTEMKAHDKVLQDLRPELASGEMTDSVPDHPVKLTLFKAAEAILSSGQKPYANVKSALRAWDAYNETGEFPRSNPAAGKEGMSWGPRNVNAYGNAFDNLNRLVAEKGEKGAADWLLDEHPVSELKEYKKEVGGKKGDMESGAKILGEKRGPFMQNLHGIESKFTADMWVSRTWNRWMGTLDLDPRIEAKGKMTSESDVPRNNTERGLMKESFEKTAGKLGLTTSSLQAVLWYYEQALYRAHGLPVESWSFSDAAKRVAGEHTAVPEAQQTGFNFGANEGEKQPTPQVPTKNPNAVHAFNFLDAIRKK